MDNLLHFPLNTKRNLEAFVTFWRAHFSCVILVVSLNLSHTSNGISKNIMLSCFTLFVYATNVSL